MDRWIARKKQAIAHMGGKCVDCGYIGHYAAYDFHHEGDKEFEWTKLRLRSWESITNELAKCVLLCAICHRIRHAGV
jgi:hypothetical protein